MTEKDDPSRVAFGRNGHRGPDLRRRSHTGNGANGNGILAGQEVAFPDSTSDRARSSKLGQLILDTLDRGVIALDPDGVVIDANAGISHQLLRDLYGLTPAQAAVTAYLFEGHSVEQTAQKLGVSVNTVRSHLKCTFAKCDVHSQAELLHLLDLGPHSL